MSAQILKSRFPLDRLSKRIDTGRYYYDDPEPLVGAMASGFKRFFPKP